MNLQQLKILVFLASLKKVSDVADAMGLKHPTVHFHMKKLEEHFGCALFDRHNHRVFLNETAQRLLPYARQIVSTAQEAEAVVLKSASQTAGKLTIGCTSNVGGTILPYVLGYIQQSIPDLRVEIKIDKPERLVQSFVSYEYDFALFYEHQVREHDMTSIVLFEDYYGFVLPPAHPLASLDSLHPLQLENERWMIREPGIPFREVFERWKDHHQLQIAFSEFEGTEAIREAVKSGLGVSILNYLSVFNDVKSGQLVFIRMDREYMPPRNLCLVYHPKLSNTPMLQPVVRLFSDPGAFLAYHRIPHRRE